MYTYSRDGKFHISVSDNSQRLSNFDGTNADEIDVYLKATEKVTLYDLASAILQDCFCYDDSGLLLCAEKLNCHVTTVNGKTYQFKVEEMFAHTDDAVLMSLSEQFDL